MSCPHCAPTSGASTQARVGVLPSARERVVLVGTPNAGKTTLFNQLTGARQDVRNSPGTTVEIATGSWRMAAPAGSPARDADPRTYTLIDLPGLYSLSPVSADERVASDTIASLTHDDVVVVVADASQLHGSLLLLGQVARRVRRIVVALTMNDVASAAGTVIDPGRLEQVLGVPVIAIDPRTGRPFSELAAALSGLDRHPGTVRTVPDGPRYDGSADVEELMADADALLAWAQDVIDEAGIATEPERPTRSDRIDRWLLNGWVGIPIFLAVLWLLFELATRLAAPIMDAAEGLVSGPVAGIVQAALGAMGIGGGWFQAFLIDGILAGVGTVVAFAPLMAMMFLAIGVLEDSGYVARVAVLADRLMRSVGLDGRVVMPLVVGFGCNLPALAATKTLPNSRQRLLTGLVIPYTSCPARLTVYILIAGIFFPRNAALVLLTMYVLSVALVVGGAWLLRRTLFTDIKAEPLALVLPSYQVPQLRPLLVTMWVRVLAFLKGAGTIIVAVLAAVWLLLAIPVTAGHSFANVPVADSAYGRIAEGVAPAFSPAGYGDWHMASSVMTGFVAKEVAVGALAQSYAVDEPDDPALAGDLGAQVTSTLESTSGGHPRPAAIAYLIFVLAYTPCLATVAEQWRLFGARWTLGAMGAQIAVAWTLSVAAFWLLRLVW
ncbi:ferrous iron transporter B [Rarobacter incanus]|uniref:Ferrous iron transport protein B n=1 Tax=Rarobacter incanus TaxID=153494 RepID=A0A542SQM7_9MICO|nr:ferrous iron transporter B [Rarobacter incanus]TQK76923.1 ferrous iron transport protein B [Rarobacter incanus]